MVMDSSTAPPGGARSERSRLAARSAPRPGTLRRCAAPLYERPTDVSSSTRIAGAAAETGAGAAALEAMAAEVGKW